MLPRRMLAWLFALALLLGQAAAFAHTLSHLSLRAHDSTPPDRVCAVCVAQAQLGSAVPPGVTAFAPPAAVPLPAPAPGEAVPQSAPLPACARAPPAAPVV